MLRFMFEKVKKKSFLLFVWLFSLLLLVNINECKVEKKWPSHIFFPLFFAIFSIFLFTIEVFSSERREKQTGETFSKRLKSFSFNVYKWRTIYLQLCWNWLLKEKTAKKRKQKLWWKKFFVRIYTKKKEKTKKNSFSFYFIFE